MSHDFTAHSASMERYIGDYLLLSTSGKGSLAEVRLAQHLLAGTKIIVKAISQWGFSKFFQGVYCLKKKIPQISKNYLR